MSTVLPASQQFFDRKHEHCGALHAAPTVDAQRSSRESTRKTSRGSIPMRNGFSEAYPNGIRHRRVVVFAPSTLLARPHREPRPFRFARRMLAQFFEDHGDGFFELGVLAGVD